MSTPIPLPSALRVAAQLTQDNIRVLKASDRAILPSRRDAALKRLDDFESELGRLRRLATELRADILALTVE